MSENSEKKLNKLKEESEVAYWLACFLAYLNGRRISIKVVRKILNIIETDDVNDALENLYRTYEFTLKDVHVYSITEAFQEQIKKTIEKNDAKIILDSLVSILLDIFNSSNTRNELEMTIQDSIAVLQNEPEKSLLLVKLNAMIAETYKNVFMNYPESLEYFLKSLSIQLELSSEKNIDTAVLLSKIGFVYRKLSKNQRALDSYQKALDIQKELLPEKHASIASSYNNIGLVYTYIGDNQRALNYYRTSFDILSALIPRRHVDIAVILGNIGMVYFKLGDSQTALDYYLKALDCQTSIHPEIHMDRATSLLNIGEVYMMLEDKEKALDNFKKALDIQKELLPEKHDCIVVTEKKIELITASLDKEQTGSNSFKNFSKKFSKLF